MLDRTRSGALPSAAQIDKCALQRTGAGKFIPSKPANSLAANGAIMERARLIHRCFQRQLGKKPTTLERYAIRRAAMAMARAEAAGDDPEVSYREYEKMHRVAFRAERALMDMIERRHQRERERQADA